MPFQLIPEILKETDFYSQLPLNLEQQVALKCPNLTEDEQTNIEVNLSKFLQNQLTEGPQSLTHLVQDVNLKKLPKKMFIWMESIANILKTMEIPNQNVATILVLII